MNKSKLKPELSKQREINIGVVQKLTSELDRTPWALIKVNENSSVGNNGNVRDNDDDNNNDIKNKNKQQQKQQEDQQQKQQQ